MSGGTLKGDLNINTGYNHYLKISNFETQIQFYSYKSSTEYASLLITNGDNSLGKKIYHVINNAGTSKIGQVFTEFNKPCGTYTGTGSSTTITINTGATSSYCILIRGAQGMAFTTPSGAICKTRTGTSVSGLSYAECMYNNGTLTINSTSNYVNKSNETYYYTCL